MKKLVKVRKSILEDYAFDIDEALDRDIESKLKNADIEFKRYIWLSYGSAGALVSTLEGMLKKMKEDDFSEILIKNFETYIEQVTAIRDVLEEFHTATK